MSNKSQQYKRNFQILLWENLEIYIFRFLSFILVIFNDRHKCYKMSKNCNKKGHFLTVIKSQKNGKMGIKLAFFIQTFEKWTIFQLHLINITIFYFHFGTIDLLGF